MSYEIINCPEVEPEGAPLERLWQSVLMDYPYYEGVSIAQSAFVQAARAQSFAAGHLGKESAEHQSYVSRWIAAGFTPELYLAVSQSVRSAAEWARKRCKDADDLLRLEERMHWLGVLSPNPRAGKKYSRFDRDAAGKPRLIEEQYPDFIVQLVPEAWADFPRRLQFHRPSAALQRHIYGDEV
ncbi:hypothetical protein AUR04nite_05540 [Glutamicibacter uratoxydans]|uniref:Uncharacterized protein n=1 Tax=Glutamicibacter uratoxydans TaxID=43667 RepID=A0A4Y4DIE1_GLUUR|nr:hypothetical protein [Glutamicibacter uratoxydans]GED05022.1 hypothetical protein AUR04nite_05540 [Glutamicibacter uratoxydans]